MLISLFILTLPFVLLVINICEISAMLSVSQLYITPVTPPLGSYALAPSVSLIVSCM